MIAMSRGIGPLGLPAVPAGTPAAAAAAGAAPGAFDAAFADLTAALLATAAGAGLPAAGKGAAVAGEVPAEATAAADESSAAAGVSVVPVVVPMPVATPAAFLPVASTEAAAGDTVTDAATSGRTASRDAIAAFAPGDGAATVGGAAISPEILGGDDIRDGWVDETFTRETRGADGGDAEPVHTPVDPILPEGLRRHAAPATAPVGVSVDPRPATPVEALPVEAQAQAQAQVLATPPTAVTAEPGGEVRTPAAKADGRTTMPGVAASSGAAAAVAAVPTAPAATADEPAAATAAPAVVDTPDAPPVSGMARRAEALQRALGRRADAEHGESAPAGLATQAARVEATVAPETSGHGQQSDDNGHEGASHQRRAIRMATAPVATASVAGTASTPAGVPARAGHQEQADVPNWRAAAMAARFAEPTAASAETARPAAPAAAAAASFAAAVVAAESPVLRDVKAALVEAPVRLPQEPVSAEHVQMQIVKSMRLQWTGTTQEARVQLRPEYLGDVVANIKVEQGVVTATLHADTPEVRRLLETQTASLREALVEHGLKLDKVVIAEPETPSGQQGDRRSRGRQPQPESSRPKPRRARDDGDGATFELSTE